jgi:hypothetical protein
VPALPGGVDRVMDRAVIHVQHELAKWPKGLVHSMPAAAEATYERLFAGFAFEYINRITFRRRSIDFEYGNLTLVLR